MKKQEIALKILCALLSNSERYNYIAHKVATGELSQEEANEKNINKALKIADSFIKKNTL